ncbi:MAG: recombination regulator RecX [Clostridium sp.]
MGKITKIEEQKRNKDRVNIYIDDEFAFAVFAELVYKNGLKVKQEVDDLELRNIFNEEEKRKCKASAIRIIERTYKTEKEMREKLLKKEYSQDAIEYAMSFLKEYNFLNDEVYTKMYVNDKIKLGGKNKIKFDLKRKGVNEEEIAKALSNVDEEGERAVAKKLCEKKYLLLKKKEEDKYKVYNKLLRFLVGKGYDYGLSSEVVREITSEEYYD